MSSIKIRRALRLAKIGRNPGSAHAMLAAIPDNVITALTGRQLAELLDATWQTCQRTKALHARAILDEGAIWSAREGRMVEIRAQ